MAVHRQRVDDADRPPVELVEFDREDWAEQKDVSWVPAVRRWSRARVQWVRNHEDSELGDLVDVLQATLRQMERMRTGEPLPPMGGIRKIDGVVYEGVYDPVTGRLRGRLPGEEDVPAGGVGTRYCDWFGGI